MIRFLLSTIVLITSCHLTAQESIPSNGLDGRPMTMSDRTEAEEILDSILNAIKGSPLFSDPKVEIEKIENGYSIHTPLTKFVKMVPTGMSPGAPMRAVEILGPIHQGFYLHVFFRNYGVIFQQGNSGRDFEPFGFSEYSTIRPQNRHFEFAFSYGFTETAQNQPSTRINKFPPYDDRFKFVHSTIKKLLEPVDVHSD